MKKRIKNGKMSVAKIYLEQNIIFWKLKKLIWSVKFAQICSRKNRVSTWKFKFHLGLGLG